MNSSLNSHLNPSLNPPLNPSIVLLLSSVLWGAAWLPLGAIHQMGLEGIPLLLIAYSAAACVMLILCVVEFYKKGGVVQCINEGLKNWQPLVLIGLTGGMANASFSLGLIEGDVLRTMALFYCLPLWSSLFGMTLLGEKVGVQHIVILSFIILGVYLILDIQWGEWFQSLHWTDCFGLVSGISYALTNVAFRYYQSTSLTLNIEAMMVGTVVILCLCLPWVEPFPSMNELPTTAMIGSVLYGAFWLSVVSLGSQYGVSLLPVTVSSIILLAELLTSFVTSYFFGDTIVKSSAWIGCGCLLGAILWESYLNMKRDSY